MQTFNSGGVEIAFLDEGGGDPILLIHGFASNMATNWIDPGWVRFLTREGYRVIAFDNRGHGKSGKLYDPSAYGAPVMAEDARRLLDHLAVPRADVMGYSMGARITAFLALAHPARVRSCVFGGLGINMVRAATVGTHPRFIRMIRELVVERMTDSPRRLALGSLGPNHDVCPDDCCLYTPARPPLP